MKLKNPVSEELFEKETVLMISVITDIVINRYENYNQKPLSIEQRRFFMKHANERTRLHYANNLNWKRKLKTEQGRDFLYIFIEHWLQAFVRSPKTYKRRYESVCS